MKVSFNPCKYNSIHNFGSTKPNVEQNQSLLTPAEKDINDIQIKKFKTTLGVVMAFVLALDIIYFAVKNRLKFNRAEALKAAKAVHAEKIKNQIPPVVLFPVKP